MEGSKAVWGHEMLFIWPCGAYHAFPSLEAHREGEPVEIWGLQSVFQPGPSITAACCKLPVLTQLAPAAKCVLLNTLLPPAGSIPG